MASSAVIGNAAIAEVAIAELPATQAGTATPTGDRWVQNWATYGREYVQRQPLSYSAQFAPPLPVVTQQPSGFLQSWPAYQRDYALRQTVTYVATSIPPAIVPDNPSIGAWVQKWNTYTREYVQGRVNYPTNVFDLGNQGNAALPPAFLQKWNTYVREYVQGNVQRFGAVPADTLDPAFSRPFKTPWRVDLYPVQQPVDAFATTLVAPPPAAPFVPPSNVRPLQSRTDWRIQMDTTGGQDYTVPDTFVPPSNVRPLQHRTAWTVSRLVDGADKTGTSQPFVPYPVVRPLQYRQGWTVLASRDFHVPVQPINTAFYPYAAGARDLQIRQGWTQYKELGQAVFSQNIAQDPNQPIVLDEEIFDFWDVAPYPSQQPKLGIATTAPLVPRGVVYSVSGGITFSGAPAYTRAYKWSPAGGIVFSGNASYTSTATGVYVPTYIYNRRFYTKLDGKR